MSETIIRFFNEYREWAIPVSIFLNVIIAILGVVPSVFLTAANILFFGFWNGTFISFIGEGAGAAISFLLYRKGFKNASRRKLEGYPRVVRVLEAKGKEAFILIFSLRLLPFVPSGLVTFAGAIGAVSAYIFIVASSIGKIPALLLEAYSVYNVTQWNMTGKVILALTAALSLSVFLKKRRL
ncbi:TVP38/TMEM64 family protein [Fictibacillus phosphorivorans]|uniref:TVP38/TMEM64 family protein n=1 Tax=Fictibacillus phosphorivorans TaxID=1221500 RepID=UPI00203B0ABE|nr:VTT domain-containing protein [Fictibacillus phosphorivorans]MCM3717398.1 VTT domain-containing protein [Fictibacillus phosphorivorans]MCM3775093.1 VTT domain-containing protein [Fictibacillus phosphorivorans]